MPRLTKSLPRYRKHKASGQAVVTLNGQDLYLGRYGTKVSEREYDRLVAEWLAGGRRLPTVEDGGVTVTELCVDYVRWAKGYYVKDGVQTNEFGTVKVVLRDLRQLYGKTLATDFGPVAFRAFRDRFVDRGLARTTCNHYALHVVGAFRLGVENEKIPAAIHAALKSVQKLRKGRTSAVESKPIPPVDLETVEATLPHLSNVVADMVRLQLLTGMRPNEVCKIRPYDVSRDSDVWLYIPESHKTEHHGKSRVVHIGPEGQAILRPYLLRDADSYCFSPAESMEQHRMKRHAERTTPESCGNRRGTNCKKRHQRRKQPGEFFKTASYGRAIRNACKMAKVSHWSPNRLRKATATMIRKHCGLEAAQVILGHSSKSTTEKWYAEPTDEVAAEVMRQVG